MQGKVTVTPLSPKSCMLICSMYESRLKSGPLSDDSQAQMTFSFLGENVLLHNWKDHGKINKPKL